MGMSARARAGRIMTDGEGGAALAGLGCWLAQEQFEELFFDWGLVSDRRHKFCFTNVATLSARPIASMASSLLGSAKSSIG